ncbi:MAG TPA: cytochrome c [Candidatus Dormibacteraeota bacterium]|nr:cytochrome c [Candidatus Dormibacteraeota bacterium]
MRSISILGLAACVAVLAAGLFTSAARGAADAAQPNPNVTVSIQYPPEPQLFKDGPGADLARANCQICHSSSYVYTQPHLTKEQWAAEVTKMKSVYGAPVPDNDIEPIAAYLFEQNGKK